MWVREEACVGEGEAVYVGEGEGGGMRGGGEAVCVNVYSPPLPPPTSTLPPPRDTTQGTLRGSRPINQ
jgi:hypothetical protein